MNNWAELTGLDCRAWELLLLRNSPEWDSLTEEKLFFRLQESRSWGLREASGLSPRQIKVRLLEERIAVKREDGPQPLMIHSDYCWDREGTCVIHLYSPVLEEISMLLKPLTQEICREQLEDLHVAHEFFHHMVRRGISSPPEAEAGGKSLRSRLFPRRRDSLLEELAAHTFARQVCAFPCHPLMLDWLLMRQRNPDAARRALEACVARAGDLKGVQP